MKKIIPVSVLALLLAGCGQSGPNDKDVQTALKTQLAQKGCASSVLFKQFPISKMTAQSNTDVLQVFAKLDFIKENHGSYVLTNKGQNKYDKSRSGFCYTDHYDVSNIKVVKEEAKDQLPSALSDAWLVSVTITPDNVDDWVKKPAVIGAASMASLDEITKGKAFTVRMAKKKNSDKLIIADPRFSFQPGIHFNMGW